MQLNYVDKFLSEIQLRFRDEYKNNLQRIAFGQYEKFEACFKDVLERVEDEAREEQSRPKTMKTFQDSEKSKKTVASLIEKKGGETKKEKEIAKSKANKADKISQAPKSVETSSTPEGIVRCVQQCVVNNIF